MDVYEPQSNHKPKRNEKIPKNENNLIKTLKKTNRLEGTRSRFLKGTEKNKNSQKTMCKVAINIYLSIITLHVNALNNLIKRHRIIG